MNLGVLANEMRKLSVECSTCGTRALSVRGPRTTHRTTGWHRSHPIINNYPAPYLRYFYNKTSREMTLLHSFLVIADECSLLVTEPWLDTGSESPITLIASKLAVIGEDTKILYYFLRRYLSEFIRTLSQHDSMSDSCGGQRRPAPPKAQLRVRLG